MATTLGERQIAYAVHETLCGYDTARGVYCAPWADTPMSGRKAMVNVVRNVRKAPDLSAGAHHELWCMRKRSAGWRWGPTLDREQRCHPSLMPWAELPEPERVREHLMVAVVKALMRPIPNQANV